MSAATPKDESPYEELSVLGETMNTGLFGAGLGVVLSAIQNSLATHRHGAMGIFTRSGGNIALMAAAAAAFGLTRSVVANARQRDSTLNSTSGACASGLVVGARLQSLPVMIGSCAAMAALVGTFDASARAMRSIPTAADVTTPEEAKRHTPETTTRLVREKRREAFFKVGQSQPSNC